MQFSDILGNVSLYKFSPDAEYFAYSESQKLWIKEATIQLKNISIINLPNHITDFEFSPNSKYIAIHMIKKASVFVYSIEGQLVSKIEDPQAGIIGFQWVKDSIQLLTFSDYSYKCSIYNFANKSITYIRGPKISTKRGCAFSSNNKFMAILQRHQAKDFIGIYYTVNWKMVNHFHVQLFDVTEIKWAPNDSFIIAIDHCINYKMLAFCPIRGCVAKFQPYEYGLGIKSFQFANSSLFVCIGSYDQKIRLVNAMTWKLIAQLDCSITSINPNQVKIFKQDDNPKSMNKMKLIDGNNYKVPTMRVINNDKSTPNQGIGLLEFSYDDTLIACKNDNMPFTVWIWQTSKLQLYTVISLSSHVKTLKWVKDENVLCIGSGTDKLLFWKNDTIMECQFPYETRKFNIQKIKWNATTNKLLMSDKTDLVFAELSAETV